MSELIDKLKTIELNRQVAKSLMDEANKLEWEVIPELQEMGIKKADLGDSEATLVPSKASWDITRL